MIKAESNPEWSAQEWLTKYKKKRSSRRAISYSCRLYAHQKCKGTVCKCRCHKK